MRGRRALSKFPGRAVLVSAAVASSVAIPATSAYGAGGFTPGNLLVSTSVWQADPSIIAGTTQLPPGCGGSGNPCATATANGSYPQVFDNDAVDGSFGVTQPIVLDEITPTGSIVSQTTVPNSSQAGITPSSDQMVTSYSSKSEMALNLSTDDSYLTFMGYNAPVDAIDVSNSNTPGDVDPTNPVTSSYYRTVAQMDQFGNFKYTETNAYSGNNGRAAILDPGTNTIYTAGNAGNGSNPEPQSVVQGAGSQILSPASGSEASQSPGQPTPLGNFNITQLPSTAADKSAKDDNFRGLTADNGVLYFSKGSGSNGVDTVYFLDTTGTACPSGGVGLPATGASLPAAGSFTSPTYSTSTPALGLTASNPGLTPTNMCILKGFPTTLAKSASNSTDYPFGIWFANSTTMYVADEGSGDATYSSTDNDYANAAASTTAGLQKWVFNASAGQWTLAYTLQNGLNLGQPYTVSGYPTGNNSYVNSKGATVTGPWAPATDGLRNLTGQVNGDGTVSLWGVTSTVSGSGDQGADPNALVSVTDSLAATSPPSGEQFQTVMAPASKQVIRGVSFVPVTQPGNALPEAPWVPLLPVAAGVLGAGMIFFQRRIRKQA